MELESLKAVFHKHLQPPVVVNIEKQIQRSIRKKSLSTVSRLKRNLEIECIVGIIFTFFPIFILIKYSGLYVSIFAAITLLLILDFVLRISKILKFIYRFQRATNALKQHLQLLLNILQKFLRVYIHSTMIMLPLLFVIAFLFIHIDNLAKDPLIYQLNYTKPVMIYSVAFFTWSVVTYLFTKWWLKKLYGKHLHLLKEMLDELNNN